MRGGRDGLVDVILEDETSALPSRFAERRSWPPLAWSRLAAAVAVLLAALVVVDGTSGARDHARRLGSTGLSGSLSAPLVEQWRAEAGEVLGVVGELLLTALPSGAGVLALRLDDGSPSWQGPQGLGACVLHGLDEAAGGLPAPSTVRRDPDGTVVVCTSYTGSPSGSQERVRVLDPGTGIVVLDVPWTSSGGGGTYADGDGLITYGIDLDSRAIAARWSLRTGLQEWFVTAAERRAVPRLDAVAHRITVVGESRAVLDLRTGRLVPQAPADVQAEQTVVLLGPVPLPDGATAVSESGAQGASRVAVREPSGDLRFRRDGSLLVPAVEERGSRSVLLVRRGVGVTGLDAETGDELWTVQAGSAGLPRSGVQASVAAVAGLAGLVVLGTEDRVLAVDRRTGAVRWSTGISGRGGPCDGYRLAVVEEGPDGASLVVLDLDEGTEVRRQALPLTGESSLVALPGGRVAQVGAAQLAVLGPGSSEG
ncbi:PQQ-binding-like beta-propeller repeat protein [Actinotalea sp.]|uniref:outer membrane protein assembly factor BamB family protein n=1 Tax=Actinotalea sp. TaxID=1872145 RepID=UPI003562B15F